MRATITMSVPQSVKQKIDKLAREQHLSRSQIIQLALNDFLFEGEFQTVRRRLRQKAEQSGIYTDEDVFTQLS